MNIKILEITPNAIQLLYKAFKTCVSDKAPTEIEIPKIETVIGDVPDNEKMIDLIKRHISHESVLEHVNITFAIEGVSRALLAQLTRHRLCSFSVQSQRYCSMENAEFVIPDSIKDMSETLEDFQQYIKNTKATYQSMINWGIPKEDARAILPNACTTNIIMTANLRELRNIFKERSCIKAQQEIRKLLEEMMKLVEKIIPFADYKCKKCNITCFECKKRED